MRGHRETGMLPGRLAPILPNAPLYNQRAQAATTITSILGGGPEVFTISLITSDDVHPNAGLPSRSTSGSYAKIASPCPVTSTKSHNLRFETHSAIQARLLVVVIPSMY